jgi:Uma2 family endonuclease
MRRYDILDGWKVYRRYGQNQLTNPTIRHQRVQSRIARALEQYEAASGCGLTIAAPCDVLIRALPTTRTRQPDVLFISRERLGERDLEDPAPLSPAPELVVEIVSPSDRPAVLAAKSPTTGVWTFKKFGSFVPIRRSSKSCA